MNRMLQACEMKNTCQVLLDVGALDGVVPDGVERDAVRGDALVEVEEGVGRQHQGAANRLRDGQAPEGGAGVRWSDGQTKHN